MVTFMDLRPNPRAKSLEVARLLGKRTEDRSEPSATHSGGKNTSLTARETRERFGRLGKRSSVNQTSKVNSDKKKMW